MIKAAFLDKDGTLIPDIPYNVNVDLITFQPGAIEGLRKLSCSGYLLIIISNQAGIAYGYFGEEEILKVKSRLEKMFEAHGLKLSGFYYCPHHPEGKLADYRTTCNCRKPQPGLIRRAAEDFEVELSSSWMIGDILNDVEAGHKAGCRSILIDNGNETEWIMNEYRKPDFLAADLSQAADFILEKQKV